MNRVSRTLERSQRIATAAIDECRRLGHPQIDLEHLFLALLVVGGPAGKVLRSQGISLAAAREAVEGVHAERIASFGIASPVLAGSTVPEPTYAQITWTERARRVSGALGGLNGDDRPLLMALLDEPSGLVEEVLAELGVRPDGVRQAAENYRPEDAAPADSDPKDDGAWLAVGVEGYVPAPLTEVWALVSDPTRRMEWDSFTHSGAQVQDDGLLVLTAATTRADGKRLRFPPDRVRTAHAVVTSEDERLIEWEITAPDRPEAPAARFSVALAPDGDGTRLALTNRWRRRQGMGALIQSALGPLQRFAVRQALLGKLAGMSRRLR